MSPDNDEPDDDRAPPREPPREDASAPAGPRARDAAPEDEAQSSEWETAEEHGAAPAAHDETIRAAAPDEDDDEEEEEEEEEEDDDEEDDDEEGDVEEEEEHDGEEARARSGGAHVRYEPEDAPAEVFGEPDPFYQPSAFDREPPRPPPRPTYSPPPRVAAVEEDEFMFGEPDIPMPTPRRPGDKQRLKDARSNLDLDLDRIKRRKRFGLFFTAVTVLFVAFVLAPVTWVGAYLFFDPPANVLMLQRAAEGQTIRHYPVPINRMSPHIVRAVIAAEDANFCTHDGFDVEAIQDAMQRNARGGRVRGASTISQQTAKNLFLWPDRSWLRKGLETYFTALTEFMWPKRRIMEAYLNTAEWGDGNFGIEAASRSYFGVSAADLTPLQAARLAAVLPNPNRWHADRPGPYVRSRSAMLVGRARVVRDERMASCVLYLDRPNAR